MDTEFRSVTGERVGQIIGTDVKDSSGNRVGYIINGSEIRDTGGNRVGMLIGSDIKDTYGNRIGMIIGNDIKDTHGNRIGYPLSSTSEIEMAAAALLLFDLAPEAADGSSRPIKEGTNSFWFFVSLAILPFIQLFSTGFWTKYLAMRKDWWRTLGSMFLFWIVFGLILGLGGLFEYVVVSIVFAVLPLIPFTVVSISRVRDAGKPWWLALIPVANFILCGFFPTKIK